MELKEEARESLMTDIEGIVVPTGTPESMTPWWRSLRRRVPTFQHPGLPMIWLRVVLAGITTFLVVPFFVWLPTAWCC